MRNRRYALMTLIGCAMLSCLVPDALSDSEDRVRGQGLAAQVGVHKPEPNITQTCGVGQKLTAYEAMSMIAHAVCSTVINGNTGYALNGYASYAACHSTTLHAECPVDNPLPGQPCGRYLCGNHPTKGREFHRFAVCMNDGLKRATFGPACFTLPQP